MRRLLVMSAALLIMACGAEPPERVASALPSVVANGLIAQLSAGWQAAPSALTPHLQDPREVLAIGTYPLRYRETDCAHVPGSALEDLGPGDALVTLQERGLDRGSLWSGFPERPARFGPELGSRSEASQCVPAARLIDHWFAFTDGDRHFHVLVAFGERASPAVREQAWSILDTLRVDPSRVPDWQSAG